MCDLLAFLDVRIPSEPRGPSTRPTATDSRFLRPTTAPPTPRFNTATPVRSTPRQPSPSLTVTRDSPTIRRHTKTGEVDFVVLDAPVPCNMAVNAEAVRQRRARDQRQRETDIAEETVAIAADRQWAQQVEAHALSMRASQQQQLRQFTAAQQRLAEQAREAEALQRERERGAIAAEVEFEATTERQQQEHQRAQAARLAAQLRHDIRAKEERRGREREERQQPSLNTLPMQVTEFPPEVALATKAHLRETWQQQLAEKARLGAEAKAADMASQQNVALQQQQHTALEEAAEAERRHRQRDQLRRYYENVQHDKAERLRVAQSERQRELAQRLAAEDAQEQTWQGLQAETLRRARARSLDLKHQIARREETRRDQRRRETETDRRMEELTRTVPVEPLLRCPVTGLLLPPSAFNLVIKR